MPDAAYMIDESHNLKDPLEDLIQATDALQVALAQALCVNRADLAEAQQDNDPARAAEVLHRGVPHRRAAPGGRGPPPQRRRPRPAGHLPGRRLPGRDDRGAGRRRGGDRPVSERAPADPVSVVAVDFGASSIRVCRVELGAGAPRLSVVHRHAHAPVADPAGVLRWDWARLVAETEKGLAAALEPGPLASIGVDTWGVDYGLLDAHGDLVAPAGVVPGRPDRGLRRRGRPAGRARRPLRRDRGPAPAVQHGLPGGGARPARARPGAPPGHAARAGRAPPHGRDRGRAHQRGHHRAGRHPHRCLVGGAGRRRRARPRRPARDPPGGHPGRDVAGCPRAPGGRARHGLGGGGDGGRRGTAPGLRLLGDVAARRSGAARPRPERRGPGGQPHQRDRRARRGPPAQEPGRRLAAGAGAAPPGATRRSRR